MLTAAITKQKFEYLTRVTKERRFGMRIRNMSISLQ